MHAAPTCSRLSASPAATGMQESWPRLKGGCTNVQGFVTRDRRKDYARESDQRLAELEQTYAEALQEGAHLM